MTSLKRHKSLLWLLAGWLFIAPFLGFQHFYSTHSPLVSDVCETCLLSSSGGHALTAQITTTAVVAQLQQALTSPVLPTKQNIVRRANARAPPITC